MLRSLAVAVLLVTLASGCSGSDDEPEADPSAQSSPSAASDPSQLSVAGDYATDVVLQDSTCPDIAVEPMTTTVEQEPGQADVELTHAGTTFHGTLSPNGSFRTSAQSVVAGDARHTLSIVGRFSSTGFTARVDAAVEQDHKPRTCEYVVTWIGTKAGDPNTVPEK